LLLLKEKDEIIVMDDDIMTTIIKAMIGKQNRMECVEWFIIIMVNLLIDLFLTRPGHFF
jgi:hypothetical protein